MIRNPIEQGPPFHNHSRRGQLLLKNRRAVRLGKDRLFERAPHLTFVNIESRDELDLVGTKAAQVRMHQPYRLTEFIGKSRVLRRRLDLVL